MNPATLSLILNLINGLLIAAPDIAKTVADVKRLIEALFTAKLITVEQQNALAQFVDAQEALRAAGLTPEHWKVQPDPVA